MNKTITLIAAEDEYDSAPGLAPKGLDTKFEGFMASRSGLLGAQDLLEHVNGVEAIGGIPDELEALGALWQVRGRHGDMLTGRHSYWSAETSVAADISRMAREVTGADDYYPGHTILDPEPDHDADCEFECIIAEARKQILAEFGDDELNDFPLDNYLTDAMHLLRRGYRKAEALYGSDWDGHDLFIAVRDAVDRIVPSVQFEGQEFILEITDGTAVCWEIDLELDAEVDDDEG